MKRISAPRRTASLSAQLVDSLRSHIESGGWPVGTRIPPEHALIEELGVGRSTLREAIGALVHLGLLEPRAGDGTYVCSSSELQSVMVRRASSAQRDKVLELRTVLEEYASGAAALRRSESQLQQLRELLADADAACAGEDPACSRRTWAPRCSSGRLPPALRVGSVGSAPVVGAATSPWSLRSSDGGTRDRVAQRSVATRWGIGDGACSFRPAPPR